MDFAATFIKRRDPGGVKMGSPGIPISLEVTMHCPGPTVYGFPPTFVATATKTATMTFYLDGVAQGPPQIGLTASFTPDPFVPVGPHTVKVVAIRKCGQFP